VGEGGLPCGSFAPSGGNLTQKITLLFRKGSFQINKQTLVEARALVQMTCHPVRWTYGCDIVFEPHLFDDITITVCFITLHAHQPDHPPTHGPWNAFGPTF
jgi:hypothetical protein